MSTQGNDEEDRRRAYADQPAPDRHPVLVAWIDLWDRCAPCCSEDLIKSTADCTAFRRLTRTTINPGVILLGNPGRHERVDPARPRTELAALKVESEPRRVAYSPDGRLLAVGMLQGTVALFETATHDRLFTLKGHTGTVFSVAFSPDGRSVATVPPATTGP